MIRDACPQRLSGSARALRHLTSPDATGKARIIGMSDDASIDAKGVTRILDRQVRLYQPEVERERVGVAGQERARAEADRFRRDPVDVVEDGGRAVVAQCAVELGP